MNTIENAITSKQIPWIRGVFVATGVVGLALFAPIVWMAVTGGMGLLALGCVVATGFAAVQTLPLLGQKLENALLAARKSEARRNPIEQLQNEMLRRAARLKAFRSALVTVGGQIESIEQMMAQRRHQDPGHILERQERALHRLKQFHGLNLNRLVQAQSALDEFRLTVQRKESEWRIALAIDDANVALDPNAADNLMQDLMTDTALRTVQDRFNNVFAELDVQMSSLDGPTRNLLDDQSLARMDELHLPEVATMRRNP